MSEKDVYELVQLSNSGFETTEFNVFYFACSLSERFPMKLSSKCKPICLRTAQVFKKKNSMDGPTSFPHPVHWDV